MDQTLDSMREMFLSAPAAMRAPGLNDHRIQPPADKLVSPPTTSPQHQAVLRWMLWGEQPPPGTNLSPPVPIKASQEFTANDFRNPLPTEWLPPGYFEPEPHFPQGTLQKHQSYWPAETAPRSPVGVFKSPPLPPGSVPLAPGAAAPVGYEYDRPRVPRWLEEGTYPHRPWSPQDPTVPTAAEYEVAAQQVGAHLRQPAPGISGLGQTDAELEQATQNAIRWSAVVLVLGVAGVIGAGLIRKRISGT